METWEFAWFGVKYLGRTGRGYAKVDGMFIKVACFTMMSGRRSERKPLPPAPQ